MNAPNFTEFNQRNSLSFKQQQRMIKALLAGKTILCEHCRQSLTAKMPSAKGDINGTIRCTKGCTNIELEADIAIK
ncbi:hypothetical protein JYB87_14170 [Shewanella avicenniae]|uniref:Uncharacterized protein n=1 Tax=Shewanella avicenniae TaxID=2814294 RepID=A0ABX7QPL8_9GAMM|nr:hypothetical protein [Shewanella avicenniae]QSX32876.1 hypothetical protein JYB87_14170 [Shewanella avicenniae]